MSDEGLLHKIDKDVGILIERVGEIKEHIAKQENRLRDLESFKWKSMGIVAAFVTVMTLLSPWIQSTLAVK